MTSTDLQNNRHNVIKIVLAFAAIYTIWGTTYLGIRIAVETIPPFLMAGTRFLFSGALIFAILRARDAPMPQRLHWRSAVILGAFLLVGGNGFVTWSEQVFGGWRNGQAGVVQLGANDPSGSPKAIR